MSGHLVIGEYQRRQLTALRAYADDNPLDVHEIRELVQSRDGKAEHLRRMGRYTIQIPTDYVVTYSLELGQVVGPCRHLSMASKREGRVPRPETVWIIAEELGFVGGLEQCAIWDEDIGHGQSAINVVQPVQLPLNGATVVRE